MDRDAELRAFDETEGSRLLRVGRYSGMSFSYVVRNDGKYCNWARGLISPSGGLIPFHEYLTHRFELTRPIRLAERAVLEEQRREAEAQRAERRQRAREERLAILAIRTRTSRGEQLLGLANDPDMFSSSILQRLPLQSLLALVGVCKTLRGTLRGLPDWQSIVSVAMAARRLDFTKGGKSRMIPAHDAKVKRFFRLPSKWKVVLEYDPAGVLRGADALARAIAIAKATGPGSYMHVRNEIRLACNDRKKKHRACVDAIEDMSDTLMQAATRLSVADNRLKAAAAAMISIFNDGGLVVEDVPCMGHPCPLSAELSHTSTHMWETFSADDGFACPKQEEVEHMQKPVAPVASDGACAAASKQGVEHPRKSVASTSGTSSAATPCASSTTMHRFSFARTNDMIASAMFGR